MWPGLIQTTFLWGLAALAVPLIIHLFFRLKTKRVELGTIRFLKIVLEQNARRRKIMRWTLLSLRLALVGLLAFLFARPYLTEAASLGKADTLTVILVDTSASMQLKGEEGTLLAQGSTLANRLIQETNGVGIVQVASFDHRIHPVSEPANQSTGGTKALSLDLPERPVGATSFSAAIDWARDICTKSAATNKTVHLITDLQRTGLDWVQVDPLPETVTFRLHDVGRSVVNNVAITDFRTPQAWVRPGQTPTVRATVVNHSAFMAEDVQVLIEFTRSVAAQPDGNESQPSRVGTSLLEGGTSTSNAQSERVTKRERLKLEPNATASVSFDLPSLGEGVWLGRIAIEVNDDLQFDNERFLAISATPAYKVLVVGNPGRKASSRPETHFLNVALKLSAAGEPSDLSPYSPTIALYEPQTGLPPLGQFDCVVLANVGELNATDAARLAEYVRGGKGLIVFSGDRLVTDGAQTLLAQKLLPGKPGQTRYATDLPFRFQSWEGLHPVFAPFSDLQHGDLSRSMFAAYTPLEPNPQAQVLATIGAGAPVVVEQPLGAGRLTWVGVSCGPDWSDWTHSRLYLPIIHQLVGHQVGLTAGGRVRQTILDASSLSKAGSVDLMATIDIGTMAPSAEDQSSKPSAAEQPGLFQMADHVRVVNISSRECDPERCLPEEFEKRFGVKIASETDQSAVTLPQQDTRAPNEIWPYLAIGLCGLLLLENFVANRTPA